MGKSQLWKLLPAICAILSVNFFDSWLPFAHMAFAQERSCRTALITKKASPDEILGAGKMVLSSQDASPAFQPIISFIQTSKPGSADLRGHFIVNLDESHSSFGFINGMDITELESTHHSVLVTRGMRVANLPEQDIELSSFSSFPDADHSALLSDTIIWQGEMMHSLYGRYAGQGAEVTGFIDDYRSGDARKDALATHFTLIVNDKELGHLQALQRTSESLTNAEDSFPDYKIDPGNKKIFEIGRFTVKAEELKAVFARNYAGVPSAKSTAQFILYQKVYAWLNHDVKADMVTMQVNEQMRRVLQHPQSPLRFTRAKKVLGKSGIPEWVLEADRKDMLLSEELITAQLLSLRIQKWLGDAKSFEQYAFYFPPNERDVLFRLGILSTNKAPGPNYIAVRGPKAAILSNQKSISLLLPRAKLETLLERLQEEIRLRQLPPS